VKTVALVVLALIMSARTALHAVVLGQPVTMPVLWLVALAVVLALAVLVLYIVRTMIRDHWPLVYPRLVTGED
jgi:hypothetical protein